MNEEILYVVMFPDSTLYVGTLLDLLFMLNAGIEFEELGRL